MRLLDATPRCLAVHEHRAAPEVDELHLGAGVPQQVELVGVRREAVHPDQRPDPQTQPGEREGGVRDPAAEPPSPDVVVDEITAGRADHHDLRRLGHAASRECSGDPAYTGKPFHARPRASPLPIPAEGTRIMHFYELHEGDDQVFADLLLAREEEMEPEEFFDVVQSIRRRVMDNYETNTLVEAIADELERDYGFIAVTDERLTAAVNVSKDEEENFLADLDAPEDQVDYATILADLQVDGGSRPN